jgi:hypothetical protein
MPEQALKSLQYAIDCLNEVSAKCHWFSDEELAKSKELSWFVKKVKAETNSAQANINHAIKIILGE